MILKNSTVTMRKLAPDNMVSMLNTHKKSGSTRKRESNSRTGWRFDTYCTLHGVTIFGTETYVIRF